MFGKSLFPLSVCECMCVRAYTHVCGRARQLRVAQYFLLWVEARKCRKQWCPLSG